MTEESKHCSACGKLHEEAAVLCRSCKHEMTIKEGASEGNKPSVDALRQQDLLKWVVARGAIILLFASAIWFTSLFFYKDVIDFVTAPRSKAMEMLGYETTAIYDVPRGYPSPVVYGWKMWFVFPLALTLPLILFFFWSLCRKVLREHERKPIRYFTSVSLLIYAVGCVLGYFILIPYTLYGLAYMSGATIPFSNAEPLRPETRDVSSPETLVLDRTERTPEDEEKKASHYLKYLYNPSHYLNLVVLLTVILGAVFQLPLIMVFLAKVGRISPRQYFRRWWVGVILIGLISIVLSPLRLSEVLITILFIFLPLLLLFTAGIGISHLAWKTRCKLNRVAFPHDSAS